MNLPTNKKQFIYSLLIGSIAFCSIIKGQQKAEDSADNNQIVEIYLTGSKLNSNDISPSILEMKINREWTYNQAVTGRLNNFLYQKTKIEFKEKEPNFIDTDLFLISVGSAIIFGATAAYFKIESDKNYDKYLKTNDKSLLNKTDRYDVYSGIALGALEINFGFLIYKFLTD